MSRSATNGIELMNVESEIEVTNVTVRDNDLNGLSVVSELVDLSDIEAAREYALDTILGAGKLAYVM